MKRLALVIACSVPWVVAAAPQGGAEADPVYRDKRVSEWIRALASPKKDERYNAAVALGAALSREPGLGGQARPARTALMRTATDADASVRWLAVMVLGDLGDAAAAPALLAALKDTDRRVRLEAAASLKDVASANGDPEGRTHGAAVAPVYCEALLGEDDRAAGVAAMGIGRTAVPWPAVLPCLTQALQGPRAGTRSAAVYALFYMGAAERLGSPSPALVGALGTLLEDADLETVEKAQGVLGRLGGAARAARPALLASLGHAEARVREGAAIALAKVDPAGAAPAVPVLAAAVQGTDVDRAIAAALALETLGPVARDAVGALRKAAKSPEEVLSSIATRTLEKLSP